MVRVLWMVILMGNLRKTRWSSDGIGYRGMKLCENWVFEELHRILVFIHITLFRSLSERERCRSTRRAFVLFSCGGSSHDEGGGEPFPTIPR